MALHKTHKATAEGKARTRSQKARRAAKYASTDPINVQAILSAQNARESARR